MVLVGPSGSGKSTALRMLAGLEDVDEGGIWIGDRDVTYERPRDRDVAMVFQSYALYPYLTVAQNIAFPLKMARVKRDERDRRVRQVAELLGLDRAPGAQARAALRRPAPARRDGAGDRPRAEGVPHGRAALEPRREAPRPDARRHRRPPGAPRRDDRLRHARPVGGDDARKPGCRAPRRQAPAVRAAAGALRAARQRVRRRLHRLTRDEPDRGRARNERLGRPGRRRHPASGRDARPRRRPVASRGCSSGSVRRRCASRATASPRASRPSRSSARTPTSSAPPTWPVRRRGSPPGRTPAGRRGAATPCASPRRAATRTSSTRRAVSDSRPDGARRSHWRPDRQSEKETAVARDALFPDGLVRPKAPYSPVVRSGDHVYTAGQVGFDASGTLVAGGVAEQTRQTLANLEACLVAAGCTLDDVVKVNVFLVDLADFDAIQRGLPRRVRGAVSRADDGAGRAARRDPRRDRGGRAALRRRLVIEVDTPAVVVDVDRLERNLARWQAHCDAVGLANRPHVKTHKSVEIARRQVALGARGITCQKLGEAEVMADAGIDDILIPYNLIGASKLERLAALARRVEVAVSVDDERLLAGLAGAGERVRARSACSSSATRASAASASRARGGGSAGRGDRAPGRAPLRRLPHVSLAARRRRVPRRGRATGAGRRPRRGDRLRRRDADDVGLGRAAPDRDRVPRRHVRVPRPGDGGGRCGNRGRGRAHRARDGRQPPERGSGRPRRREQGADARSLARSRASARSSRRRGPSSSG